MSRKPVPRTRGFSLIEVLVALIIIAIGLLGMASIQALAVGSTGVARTRSIAAIQVSSLAAAMHANKGYWGSGVAPSPIGVSSAAVSSSPAIASYADCTAAACTSAAQMALYDLSSWGTNLATVLPNGTATITCTTTVGSPVTCNVAVTWSEKYVAANAAAAASAAALTATQTYSELVQP